MSGLVEITEFNPFSDRSVVNEAVPAVNRAEAMGLIDAPDTGTSLDAAIFEKLVEGVTHAGLASSLIATLYATIRRSPEVDPEWLRDWFGDLSEILDDSPVPAYEWEAAKRFFDHDQLSHLLGISTASVTRYAAAERKTPQKVALRLHWLMLCVGDLLGSYNDYGVRRWFERPRTVLGSRSPEAVLRSIPDGWTPDHPDVQQVRNLAHALTASSAT